MELKQFAEMLSGKQYAYEQFSREEIGSAKIKGFVIVSGVSDDLMEFSGAINDESSCYDGGKVYFTEQGIYDCQIGQGAYVEAVWCDENQIDENGKVIPWTYKADIPHETFMIYDGEEPYCRGIVFRIDDIK